MSNWDHVKITCCNCGAPIMLHASHEEKLRASHDSFYCPAGHSNYFPGKTKVEKERDDLKRQLARSEQMLDDWRDRWESVYSTRSTLATAVQVCPLGCGHVGRRRLPWQPNNEDVHRFLDRVGSDLTAHLTTAHNATVKAQRLLTERTS